jgi:branched-chain amino acid transport system permease protein
MSVLGHIALGLRALSDRPILLFAIVLAAGIVAPFAFYPVFLMNVLCFALFASAFNLLVGYAGLLSFGHAAFFGGAGYVTAYAMKTLGFPVELGLLAGVLSALILGVVFGLVAIRRQGVAFAMVTLALSQMVYFYAVQAPWMGGEDGIQSIPRGHLFGMFNLNRPFTLYYFVLAVTLIGFAAIYRAVHSPFGRVLGAIRQNEPRTTSLGFKTDHFKFFAFVLSASLSGLAGSLHVLVFQIASLAGITWHVSGEVVLMTLVGGAGTLFGPSVGALVILAMTNYLTAFGSWITVIQGLVFIVCVLAFREGIVGEAKKLLRKAGEAADRRAAPRATSAKADGQ